MRQDPLFPLRLAHSARLLALVFGLALAAFPIQAQELIPWRSAWKYVDDGVNRYTQTPPFYHPDYNEALWKTGSGRFGYGGDGESTAILFGPNAANKFPTTYFRREFTWDGQKNAESDTLLLEFSRDDGAMIYLNGTLISVQTVRTARQQQCRQRSGLVAKSAFPTRTRVPVSGEP